MASMYRARSLGFIVSIVSLAVVTLCAGRMFTESIYSSDGTAGWYDISDVTLDRAIIDNLRASIDALKYMIASDPARIADEMIEKRSAADKLYASISQPGQDWRFSVDSYRHIDPGRLQI